MAITRGAAAGVAATPGKAARPAATAALSPWLAPNPAKRWTELFFLLYSLVWITWLLIILVPFRLYERLGKWGYMSLGVAAATPCVVLPPLLAPRAERGKPWAQRYWVKANLWIAIFSFIGNYFWTHYFYRLLGASYTFPAHNLNQARASHQPHSLVPITLFLMTHAYFCLYHALSNLIIRRARAAAAAAGPAAQAAAEAAVVLALAYATAYGETLTIAHFPYYSFKDRDRMYTVGSLFYAIYFFVSFPMFFRMDEEPRASRALWRIAHQFNRAAKHYTLWRAAVDALAAGMLVTCLLDFWRISFGSIVDGQGGSGGLPWLD
eukprot:scaffold1.g5552.t1